MTAIAEPTLDDTCSEEPNPARSAEDRDDVARILDHLGDLTDNQQECIRLKFQHGLSYREIAAVTDLTATNVGFLIHTGLKRLREQLNRDE